VVDGDIDQERREEDHHQQEERRQCQPGTARSRPHPEQDDERRGDERRYQGGGGEVVQMDQFHVPDLRVRRGIEAAQRCLDDEDRDEEPGEEAAE
jgi:hypothetical protein